MSPEQNLHCAKIVTRSKNLGNAYSENPQWHWLGADPLPVSVMSFG
jgi:hypothetical protein